MANNKNKNKNKNKIKILVIEDNADLVDMYKFKLEREGYFVDIAKDGEQGLLKATEISPDLILLDILTPNMDGWEVLTALKNNTSLKSKVIIVSNLGEQEQVDRAKKLGVDGYLIKANYTPGELVMKIKEFL